MNKEETNALQLLSGKLDLADVSVEELERLANEYPYFSAAQLLLAKKLKLAEHPHFEKQLYKTALFFPDQNWLQYLLSDLSDHEKQSQPEQVTEVKEEEIVPVAAVSEPEPVVETVQETVAATDADTEDENLITLPAEELLEEIPFIDRLDEEPEEAPLDEEELAAQSLPLPMDESSQKISSVLSEQAEQFQKPVSATDTIPIESEPFHTVDYFASQGINLEAKKEETQFDTKVHKFTDWLRKMKRINPHPSDLGTDEEQEIYVANIAASSNLPKEIVTESMAEVLGKQGKRDKALEIYEKLSLLYPAKNAYFAAKIEQLKS